MGKTAVGLYESDSEARQVLRDLVSAGFDRSNIRIMLGDESAVGVREWFDDDSSYGNRGAFSDSNTALTSVGVPAADARNYAEALRRGNALVSVSTTDARIDEAVAIMSRYNILDINDRMRSWGSEYAATGAAATGAAATNYGTSGYTTGATTGTLNTGEEATVPVIEEEVHVGKREVERGGVRVRAVVSESPVEETVNLRQERVEVERRPVDRAVSNADLNNLRDQTIEVRERAEEAVVEKQARVVEEVVVRKDVDVEQATIQDTVRRTDVEVEQLGRSGAGTGNMTGNGWERWSNDFNTHYRSSFANTGRDYSYYEPAYRYGYGLSSRNDWRGRSWNEIEPDVRRDWESRNQGPWEEFKDAVRYAWQRVTA